MSYLNNLDPRVKELMDQDEAEFPNLVGRMKREIADGSSIGDLTLTVCENLLMYFEQAGGKFDSSSYTLKIYQIFGQ